MAQSRVHILVADPSLIIRSGVVSTLINLDLMSIDIAEVSDMLRLSNGIEELEPDIVIVNPQYLGMTSPNKFKSSVRAVKFIALQNSFMGGEQLRDYDAVISILDSEETIEQTLSKLIGKDDPDQVELSHREKEIVRAVAKGLSNKEIADQLSISTNTVTTHRRNIASKLEIRNSAGLTIYAIVNGLIDISEVAAM